MSDKPEQEQPKEENPKAKKEEHAEPKVKKEPPAAPQEASPQAKGESKRKKISRMKLEEVEAEIKIVKEKMGGFQSSFAQHLLARKNQLAESAK